MANSTVVSSNSHPLISHFHILSFLIFTPSLYAGGKCFFSVKLRVSSVKLCVTIIYELPRPLGRGI